MLPESLEGGHSRWQGSTEKTVHQQGTDVWSQCDERSQADSAGPHQTPRQAISLSSHNEVECRDRYDRSSAGQSGCRGMGKGWMCGEGKNSGVKERTSLLSPPASSPSWTSGTNSTDKGKVLGTGWEGDEGTKRCLAKLELKYLRELICVRWPGLWPSLDYHSGHMAVISLARPRVMTQLQRRVCPAPADCISKQ